MKLMGESIGVIADDLTGACDTGLQFNVKGITTRIVLDYTDLNLPNTLAKGPQNFIVNTNSRHVEELDAVAAVRKSLRFLVQQANTGLFYKKMDSTLRGHVAQECLAMIEELDCKAAIVAPAYPGEGRRTVGGYQLVRGLPVEQSDVARDPLFPVFQSHLPTLLGNQSDPELVGYVPLKTVLSGAGPILKALQTLVREDKKLIVVDACSDTDLEQLALALSKMPEDSPVLPCGSAGLAKALTDKWVITDDEAEEATFHIPTQPFLMVIGSVSATTQLQLHTFMDTYNEYLKTNTAVALVELTASQILGLDSTDAVIHQMDMALSQGKSVVLTAAYQPDAVKKASALAAEHDIEMNRASHMTTECLGALTRAIRQRHNVHLIMSGGETAMAVCRALGAKSLQVVDRLSASIPLLVDDNGTWMVTKSGSFGTKTTLLDIVNTLAELEAPVAAK
ncbi:MAG: four-carbon acid sugar kinase family protein [Cyanobacteria bacterium HKST-UBA04]|nr:four-carbon acid sugar kinase family protein [Cyanobacteria bacterium HKST-UBA04]